MPRQRRGVVQTTIVSPVAIGRLRTMNFLSTASDIHYAGIGPSAGRMVSLPTNLGNAGGLIDAAHLPMEEALH
jgi:hypothetical protein